MENISQEEIGKAGIEGLPEHFFNTNEELEQSMMYILYFYDKYKNDKMSFSHFQGYLKRFADDINKTNMFLLNE